MLGKLMKYEFKAMGRVFLPLFGALIILSVMNRILLSLDFDTPKKIGIIISVILMAGIVVVALMLTIGRFNKNLLQNEGYLMLTLPVSTDSLILSKLFVAAIWSIASFIVVIASILIMAVTDFSFTHITEFFRMLGQMLPIERMHSILYIIEAVIAVILWLFTDILILYACLSLSLLVNRRRGLFSFGAFIAITILLQVIAAIGFSLFDGVDFLRLFDGLNRYSAFHIFMFSIIAISLALSAAFYFTTRYMLKNKLNLQ